jgi:hypothetical protein
MRNELNLFPITMWDGKLDHTPRLVSINMQTQWVCLTVKGLTAAAIPDFLFRIQSNPTVGPDTEDWQNVMWDNGTILDFTEDDTAVLPACNQYIRALIAGDLPVDYSGIHIYLR